MPSVNLVESKPLYFLERVNRLDLSDNLIEDFEEHIAPILATLQHLTKINLNRNPVVKLTHKYRDQVVMLTSHTFLELDDMLIKPNERKYLQQLNQRKVIRDEKLSKKVG